MVKGDPTGEVRQTNDFVDVGDDGEDRPRPVEDTSDNVGDVGRIGDPRPDNVGDVGSIGNP